MGLGSIVGTGVFVSLSIAAGVAGPAVVVAVALAAFVALFNGLSSAQLAASHPVSGGTYEYGYRYLHPRLGFAAGWMFLCAKSASAATAALGFSGYWLNALGVDEALHVPVAAGIVGVLTVIVLAGLKLSKTANAVMVALTLGALGYFVVAGLPAALRNGGTNFAGLFAFNEPAGLLHATALLFVAYTGYGRIATLGEEVREPEKTIPRAIVTALTVTMLLYVAVATVAVAAAGAGAFTATVQAQVAPLESIARGFGALGAAHVLAVGAMTAMLGVLLNLILGLSRVLLAMGRRRDMPGCFAKLNAAGTTPPWAVLAVGALILGLVFIGNVKTTWSFSAFTVLVYYALTNLAVLRLPPEQRRFPRAFAWAGLAACVFLAFWVEHEIWLAGLGLLAAGLVWQQAALWMHR